MTLYTVIFPMDKIYLIHPEICAPKDTKMIKLHLHTILIILNLLIRIILILIWK